MFTPSCAMDITQLKGESIRLTVTVEPSMPMEKERSSVAALESSY